MSRKRRAALMAGAGAAGVIVVWVLDSIIGLPVPDPVRAAIASLLGALAGLL